MKLTYARAAGFCLVLAAIILAAFMMTGCASVQRMEAHAMGLSLDAPVPQTVYEEVVLPPTITYDAIEKICGVPAEGSVRAGCVKMSGTRPSDYCVVVYTEGDYLTRAHERCHCSHGQFHDERGRLVSADICRG